MKPTSDCITCCQLIPPLEHSPACCKGPPCLQQLSHPPGLLVLFVAWELSEAQLWFFFPLFSWKVAIEVAIKSKRVARREGYLTLSFPIISLLNIAEHGIPQATSPFIGKIYMTGSLWGKHQWWDGSVQWMDSGKGGVKQPVCIHNGSLLRLLFIFNKRKRTWKFVIYLVCPET